MTYMKPEMEIEKFNIIEEITDDVESAAAISEGGSGSSDAGTASVDQSIGNDLIIG